MKQSIIACDPSLTAFGYVVLQNNKIVAKGCIKTAPSAKKLRIRKGDDRVRRFTEIANKLVRVCKKYKVACVLAELPHGSQNANAAISLGGVTGVIVGVFNTLKIPIEWYSEGDSKISLLGKKNASKKETIDKCIEIFDSSWVVNTKYKDEAVADSLSIYYLATKQSPLVQMINNLSH